jgi:hypothetical protein
MKIRPNQLAGILLEDAGAPFDRTPVTLQYRPYRNNEAWSWFWLLLPEDGSKALARGTCDSRAAAATAARLAARELKVTVAKIAIIKPYVSPTSAGRTASPA